MRFADWIVNARSFCSTAEGLLASTSNAFSPRRLLADGCEILLADNIREYYDETVGTERAYKSVFDLPAPFPPFQRLWLEYEARRQGPPTDTTISHAGLMIIAYPDIVGFKSETNAPTANMVAMELWYRYCDGTILGPAAQAFFSYSDDRNVSALPRIMPLLPGWQAGEQDYERGMKLIARALNIAQLSFCFANCKNVSLNVGIPEGRDIKQCKKLTGGAPLKHYILNLSGLKSLLRDHGNIAQNGLRRALHICRGHFRTYDETAKLFGKLTGTYWIPSHTRGDASAGEVRKWYSAAPR